MSDSIKSRIEDMIEWYGGDAMPFDREKGKWLSKYMLLEDKNQYCKITIDIHLLDRTVITICNRVADCWRNESMQYCNQVEVGEEWIEIDYGKIIPYTAIAWIEDKCEDVDWDKEIQIKEGGAS